jgi:hypothetical protein
VQQELRVRRALKELPEQLDPQVLKERRVFKAQQVRKALRATLAPQAPKVFKVFKEKQV